MSRLPDSFIVICKERGAYVLTTRRVFSTSEEALAYAGTCSDSRDPLVIPGDFRGLRFSEKEEAEGGERA